MAIWYGPSSWSGGFGYRGRDETSSGMIFLDVLDPTVVVRSTDDDDGWCANDKDTRRVDGESALCMSPARVCLSMHRQPDWVHLSVFWIRMSSMDG